MALVRRAWRALAAVGWAALALVAAAGLALSALAALMALPFSRPFIASRVVALADAAIAGRLELEGIEVLSRGGIELRGVEVYDPHGHLVLSVGRARVFADVTGLRARRIGLTAELDGPSVLLEEEEDGGLSLVRAFAPARREPEAPRAEEDRGGGPGWTVLLSRATVRRGDVWWVDAGGETRLEASALDLDGRALLGAGRTRVDLRLRGFLAEPVAAPLALDVVGGITGDEARVRLLHAELGGTALHAVGEGDLARRTGRIAVARLGVGRDVTRALAPGTPEGDDLSATGYAESDGTLATAAVRVEPAGAEVPGRADAAVALRLSAPAAALGFDVAVDRLDPSRLAAWAPPGEVTLVAHGAAAGRTRADLRARVAATVSRSRLRGGVVSRAELQARADAGRVDVQRLVAAAPGLSVDASLSWRERGPVAGRAVADAADLDAALRNLAALLGRDLGRLGGRARVEATLAGTGDAPRLAARVDAPALRAGGLSLARGRFDVEASGSLGAPSARVEGSVAAVRSGGGDVARAVALRAGLAGEEGTLSATASLPGFRDPATVDARGRLGPRRQSIAISELALAYPGARWALAGPATVALAGPTVDRLELASDGQRITVQGGLGRRGALDARAEVASLDLARLPAGLLPQEDAIRGEVDATLLAAGTTRRPLLSATFSVREGSFRNLTGAAANGTAAWDGAARRATATVALSVAGGAADVALDVPVPLAGRPGERVSATARAARLPLPDLLAAARLEAPLAGVLGLDASLEGTAGAPALRASATLTAAAYQDLDGLGLEVALEDPGERLRVSVRAALDGDTVATADVAAPLDVADLLARPAAALRALRRAPLEGAVAVTDLALASVSGRAGVPDGLAGALRASAALSGTAEAPRARATVDVARGVVAGYRDLGAHVEAALLDGAVRAAGRLTLAGDEALRFDASLGAPVERLASPAALRAAPLRGEVIVPTLSLARAATQDLPLTGTVAARLAVAGTPRAPEVTLTAGGEGVAVEGRPLGEARVEARYAGARTEATLELRPAAGGALRATFALDADLGLGGRRVPLREAPAEATAKAEALDLGFLAAVAPRTVRAAAGKLAMDVRARGPLGRLSPRGTLRVADGRLAVSEYGEWTGIAVEASVTDDAVELARVDVRRGSGRLSASGSLRGLRGDRAQLEARLAADGFTVTRAGMDLATLDLQADATGGYSEGTLAVEVKVPRGVIRLPDRTPRSLQTLERRKDIVVGRKAAERRARAAGEVAAAAVAGPPVRPFTLAAHVVVPRNLFVKSADPEVDLELKADVRYERIGAEDYAEGSIEVVRGSVEPIGGRTFHVQRGRVQFTGGPPSAAMLDVEAKYDNPVAVVTVTVQGPLTNPEIKLSSQPPMDDAQIAMLIATGRTELKAGGGGVGGLTGEEAGRAALGAIATQAFKNLVADKLPLDTVTLESGALRAGKYLPGGKIYVGYVRRFDADPERGENPDEVRVEYQISPRWTFESRYGTAQSGGASLVWSKDY